MDDSREEAKPSMFWQALFDYQRQASRIFRTMIPEPFSSSLQTIEDHMIAPMQENMERFYITMLNNSLLLTPWHEEFKEEDKDRKEQRKAA